MEMKFQPSSVILQQLFLAAAIIFNLFFFVVSSDLSVPHESEGGLRGLKSFKEKPSGGSNITFDCSPSGPCVPCLYSEKKHQIYRCSETGYRIPMKCVKLGTTTPLIDGDGNDNKNHKGRTILENINDKLNLHEIIRIAEKDSTTTIREQHLLQEDSSSSSSNIDVGSVVYVTYRSCITAVNEEKLSVLGFEALMWMLLVSSSFVIFRRKGTTLIMPGAVRVPTNPRF